MPKRNIFFKRPIPAARPSKGIFKVRQTRHVLFGCLIFYIFLSVNDIVYHPGHALHFLIYKSGIFRDRGSIQILPEGVETYHHQFVCPPRRNTRMTQTHIPGFQKLPDLKESTSFTNSTYAIVRPKPIYNLCDEIEVLIRAKDWRNFQKFYGGDYFRAKIYSMRYLASAPSDGDIVDNGDGTYSAFFTLRWPGEVKIGVNLIHPSEAVYVLNRLRSEVSTRFAYNGRFISPDGNTMENVECHVSMENHKGPLCDYSDRTSGASWFCAKPNNTDLSCDDWMWHVGNVSKADTESKTLISKSEAMLFYIQKAPIKRQWLHSINVSWPSPPQWRDAFDRTLPDCQPGLPITSSHAAGYFFQDVWFSNQCKIRRFKTAEALQCLQHKTLHYLGDSTVRQFLQFFLIKFRTLTKIPLEPHVNWKVGPFGAHDETNNITMHYKHHGYPIRNSWTLTAHVDYMVNVINSIQGGADTVVVITAWAHFTATNITYYTQRMQSVLQAIKDLHRRSPDTLVILRGGNTREHDGLKGALYTSDWYAKALDKTMRETFSMYPKVAFLDMWDMTSAHYSRDSVHPTEVIVANAMNQLLTFICPPGKSLRTVGPRPEPGLR